MKGRRQSGIANRVRNNDKKNRSDEIPLCGFIPPYNGEAALGTAGIYVMSGENHFFEA